MYNRKNLAIATGFFAILTLLANPAQQSLVALACNPAADLSSRLSAVGSLARSQDPRSGLSVILQKADATVAASAAQALIRLGLRPVDRDAITNQIGRFGWSERLQLATELRQRADDSEELPIVQTILESCSQRAKPDYLVDRACGAVALRLTLRSSSRFNELLVKASQARPNSTGLLLASSGIQRQNLPQALPRGEPRALNLARAVNLGVGGREYVNQTIRALLAEYAHENWEALTPTDEADRQRRVALVLRFDRERKLLGALRFADDATAKAIVFEYLNAPNRLIRLPMRVIAAMRWSEDPRFTAMVVADDVEERLWCEKVRSFASWLRKNVAGKTDFSLQEAEFNTKGLIELLGDSADIALGNF